MILLHALLIPEERYNAAPTKFRDQFNWWEYDDYMVNILYDAITDRIVYHKDNIHGHPEDFIEGYTHCLRNIGLSCDTHKTIIVLPQGVDEYNYIEICPYVLAYVESLKN